MDPLSFGFLGLVLVLGGVVAFLADGLGRKIGKTRRTLFGLRPRHTATLLTVAAGVLIPLLTVGVLAIASRDFRQWVTEGRAAIALSRDLQKSIIEKTKDIAVKTNQKAEIDRQLQDSQSKVAESVKLLKESEEDAKLAQNQAKAAQARIPKLNAQLAKISASLKVASDKLSLSRVAMANLKRASADLQRSYALIQQDLKDSYDQSKKLTDDNVALNGKNEELINNSEKLRKDIERLGSEQAQLTASIDKAKIELESAQGELTTALRDLDDKTAQLSRVSVALNSTLNSSRMQPLIFKVGEELARIQLRAGLLPIEALAAIRRIQADAAFIADQRGARSPAGGPSAGLFPIKQDDGRIITVEEQEQGMSSAMRNNRDEIVLIAYASLNTFQGEYVSLVLRSYRNPVVYRMGETITEGRIDGSMAEHTILDRLSSYLETQVREAAAKKGMIPVSGREGGLGAIPSEQMFGLVRQISEVGRTVRVIATAANDTRAADPLKLEFRLR